MADLFTKNDLNYYHCIYFKDENKTYNRISVFRNNKHSVEIPQKLTNTLKEKCEEYGCDKLHITIATSDDVILITMAITHPEDNFCRKTGRVICRNRMNKYWGKRIKKGIILDHKLICWDSSGVKYDV